MPFAQCSALSTAAKQFCNGISGDGVERRAVRWQCMRASLVQNWAGTGLFQRCAAPIALLLKEPPSAAHHNLTVNWSLSTLVTRSVWSVHSVGIKVEFVALPCYFKHRLDHLPALADPDQRIMSRSGVHHGKANTAIIPFK
jgi:hypothetical protein